MKDAAYGLIIALSLVLKSSSAVAGGPYQTLVDPAIISVVIEVHTADPTKPENTRLMASALAVLLGPFGAHRLYLGTNTTVAVVYGLTFGGFGVLALIDLGHLLFSKDLDRFRNNDRVFMWTREREPTPP
ncbi:MAG: TM2 domain-containing protein [Flavobacteriales bacterium]|nr:TM2 domain-containing protein [Flavobacteriales bacterium]